MKFGKFAKAFAPVIAIAFAAGLSGCDGAKIKFNGEEGKKLADLDLTGAAPTGVAMFGPDTVRITEGPKLTISVEGDSEATENMRFSLKDGTLGVLRKDGSWKNDKTVTVNVTLPALHEVSALGSGSIHAAKLTGDAKINVAGSGSAETPDVSADTLEVSIAGSGNYRGAGQAKSLELNIAGSGSAEMDALKVDKAEINIAGSGDARFASDGTVNASMLGSGEVTVRGRATCQVSAVGSGRLICETAARSASEPEAPLKPEAPKAPKAPKAPEAPE